MAFEGLTNKLSEAFKRLRGKGILTQNDVKEACREIRLALLEADVNFKVVRDLIEKISARAVGSDILQGLNPAQQIVKIVNEELTALMGGSDAKISISSKPPTVVMLVGLQGAGKTTNGAKVAGYFKKQGKRPLLVACDIYRPAAITQLEIVGEKLDIPVFSMGQTNPVEIAKAAVAHAIKHSNDMVFIDTAGRLHIDNELMDELCAIKSEVNPHEILLVLDAMTGQDAVNAASAFNERLDIDGCILTKLDGDARGGAALSVLAVTGKPIKFIGTGEKLEDLDVFHPDRMASRILGMGDVLSFIEKAQEAFDEKKAVELERKIKANKMDLNDLYDQMKQLKGMGNMTDLMGMIPGVNAKALKGATVDEKQLDRIQAIIQSMTPYERENPQVLNYSRKRRISLGSGTKTEDINKLLKQFDMMTQMAKQMTNPGAAKKKGSGFRLPF